MQKKKDASSCVCQKKAVILQIEKSQLQGQEEGHETERESYHCAGRVQAGAGTCVLCAMLQRYH